MTSILFASITGTNVVAEKMRQNSTTGHQAC